MLNADSNPNLAQRLLSLSSQLCTCGLLGLQVYVSLKICKFTHGYPHQDFQICNCPTLLNVYKVLPGAIPGRYKY